MTTFFDLGLSKPVLASLAAHGYETPTPIQLKAIPTLLEGKDLIGLAQTGTGKTAAFGLPIIEMLLADGRKAEHRTTRALVLAPTRELVNQIATNLRIFVKKSPMKIGVVVGGVSINKQQQMLSSGLDILVATPGRLLDLIAKRSLSLSAVTHLVLDEADQMLDLGFIHDLKKIARMVPEKRQTLLFSATMPKAIADLAGSFLTSPVKVEVTPPGRTADRVQQSVHFVIGKNDKTDLLKEALDANPDGRSIVFMRTKHTAEKLMKYLDSIGYPVASIHGNKSQGQRDRALKAFRDGEVATLIATDVAARGIDIPDVTHVFNYDLPEVAEAYVHRIGRTARAGREGLAIAFCTPDEYRLLRDIEKLTGVPLTVAGGEPPERIPSGKPKQPQRGQNRGGGRPQEARGNGGRDHERDGQRGERARNGNRDGNRDGAKREDRAPRPARERFHAEAQDGIPAPQAAEGKRRPPRKPPTRRDGEGAVAAGDAGNRNHRSGHSGRPNAGREHGARADGARTEGFKPRGPKQGQGRDGGKPANGGAQGQNTKGSNGQQRRRDDRRPRRDIA